MNIVIVGHVDHGKSTVIGRLLADTGSLPEGKLESVKEKCLKTSKPFEYAFLLDALKEEQEQGITIDSARCFFKTEKRKYIIIDAPGHIEFLKNMVSGAARAEAALLVIDAEEGIQENTKRHGYMLSVLGIKQIAVLINKMDLVNYSQDVFNSLVKEYSEFLKKIDIVSECFIPISGRNGDNIAFNCNSMDWYKGDTVLSLLDKFKEEQIPEDNPFRMPVQAVYKFTQHNDNRRIIAGTVETGKIKTGDEIIFYPTGKTTIVKSLESFNDKPEVFRAGDAAGFTMQDQIYIKRGELAVLANEKPPQISSKLLVRIFWLNKNPLIQNKEYLFKIGTAKVRAELVKIRNVMDCSELKFITKNKIERHDVAECELKLDRAVAFDRWNEVFQTSRFVIIDDYEISGGGIIIDKIDDEQSEIRNAVISRNIKWEKSSISQDLRAEKYNQKSCMIIVTGLKDSGKKPLAKNLEKILFDDGKIVYFLGIRNILYGVDSDIANKTNKEHWRRLGEISHILMDMGAILIVTATEITNEDYEIIKTSVNPDLVKVIWIGDKITTDIKFDIHFSQSHNAEESAQKIKYHLQDKGIIFKP